MLLTRTIGGLLLAFAVLPLFRVVSLDDDAPVRTANVAMAAATLELAWWGTLVVLLSAYVLGRLWPEVPRAMGEGTSRALTALPSGSFGLGLAAVALILASLVTLLLYQGLYTNVDEMASLVHARYLAQGALAGPAPPVPEAWLIPNTLLVDGGWVSQYPPSHLTVMAAFVRLGAPLLMGPVMFGVMVWLLALALPRLIPERVGAMRIAAALTALSPMLLFLAGGGLSHLTAGAALAAALYGCLRARDGHAAWGWLAGMGIGVAVSARPLTGLVLGTMFPVALWAPRMLGHGAPDASGGGQNALNWGLRRVAGMLAGGVPFAVALGAYHAALFGGPTQWGYLAAFGSDHGLGFHDDPWGYAYGPLEALAFTSTDLIALGTQLLETFPPLTVALGVGLLLRPRLPKGSGVLLAWAFLPILAHASYWFHAPRMYFEAAPAWIALGVLAVAGLTERRVSTKAQGRESWHPMGAMMGWTACLALLGALLWAAPARWASYAWDEETLARITVPETPGEGPDLIFVHTPWTERVSAVLQGAGGMRQDSVTVALRRNGTCTVHRYAEARDRGEGAIDVDLTGRAGTPGDVIRQRGEGGSIFRVHAGETLTPECAREIAADRFGTVALAPLVWQGDLPGDEHGRPMFVRDLGPEKNARVRAAFPRRTSWVLVPRAPGAPPELVPYAEAMQVLWGAEAPGN